MPRLQMPRLETGTRITVASEHRVVYQLVVLLGRTSHKTGIDLAASIRYQKCSEYGISVCGIFRLGIQN